MQPGDSVKGQHRIVDGRPADLLFVKRQPLVRGGGVVDVPSFVVADFDGGKDAQDWIDHQCEQGEEDQRPPFAGAAVCGGAHSQLPLAAVLSACGVGWGLTSYSGCGMPINHSSNQPTMWSRRSTRCQGSPDRESSWVSRGNMTIAVGRFRYFKARNSCSPPESGGVRESDSPSTNSIGV